MDCAVLVQGAHPRHSKWIWDLHAESLIWKRSFGLRLLQIYSLMDQWRRGGAVRQTGSEENISSCAR